MREELKEMAREYKEYLKDVFAKENSKDAFYIVQRVGLILVPSFALGGIAWALFLAVKFGCWI